MENIHQERVLAYTLSTPLDQEQLTQVSGGASSSPSSAGRVVITGDHSAPDVVIEF